jgi:hypothetical protein
MAQSARAIHNYFFQALVALALSWPQAASAEGVPAPPANALLLFGARWCAPCGAELRGLAPLAAALATQPGAPRLVLAWIDRPAPLPHDHPPVILPSPAWAAVWAEPHFAAAHGLPFAVLTDGQGRTCAMHAGPLAPADLPAMAVACHR